MGHDWDLEMGKGCYTKSFGGSALEENIIWASLCQYLLPIPREWGISIVERDFGMEHREAKQSLVIEH
jgi:hypothetical protein